MRAILRVGLLTVSAGIGACTVVVDNELDKKPAHALIADSGTEADASDGSQTMQDSDGGSSSVEQDSGVADATGGPGQPDAGTSDAAMNPSSGQVQLCVGYNHACGIDQTGHIHCWGANAEDQTKLPTDRSYRRVACGDYHTCAIDSAGALLCAGRNRDGQRVNEAGPFTEVAAGYGHTCVLTADGKARCFGLNDSGQATPPDEALRAITAGKAFSCGIRASDGTIVCWGSGASSFVSAVAGKKFLSLDAAPTYLCGMTDSKEGLCWGDTNYSPPPLGLVDKMAAGDASGCALLADGKVRCWYQGQWGDVEPDKAPFADVAVGGTGRCLIPKQGAVVCGPADQTSIAPGPNDFP